MKKRQRKKRETQERRNSLEKLSENLWRRENTKGKTNIASWYPVKATIAHTQIQRELNFASFEG